MPSPVSLKERIHAEITAAMRSGDSLRRDVLRMAQNAIDGAEKRNRRPCSDDEVVAILVRETKTRRESIEAFRKGGRDDLAAKKKVRSAGELFVATGGNDQWSGTLPEPNAAGTDGPLATLGRARDEARKQRAAGQPVKVLVRGGTYFLEAPFVLEPQDSGTAETPALFAAYPGERPIFSGGRSITGWQKGRASCGRWKSPT